MANPYAELAYEVTAQPEVMEGLADWFDSGKARSAFQFGVAVGSADADSSKVAAAVASWMETARCPDVVAGYLCGAIERRGELPSQWRERLDQVAQHHAEYAAMLTFRVDQTHPGFDRIMRLARSGKLECHYLREFYGMLWLALLNNQEKTEILSFLRKAMAQNDSASVAIALDLIAWWTDYGKNPPAEDLLPPMLDFLKSSLQVRVDPGHWLIVVRVLAVSHPAEVAEIILNGLTSPWPCQFAVEEESLEILRGIAAAQPHLAMAAVGQKLEDSERRSWLGMLPLPGLFETIGREVIQDWIRQHGTKHLKDIAQHLDSPRLQDGKPYVPPVTEWILTEFGQDEEIVRRFFSGRHLKEARWGHARDHRAELEKSLEPFLHHSLRRVREWAEYELSFNDEESRIDDLLDENHERV